MGLWFTGYIYEKKTEKDQILKPISKKNLFKFVVRSRPYLIGRKTVIISIFSKLTLQ
jgi:hypothetical protein